MQPERSEDAALLDDALSAFVSVRPRLFGIAYRILASGAEAEDIVQDVWLRWQTTDRSVILDAPALLVTMAAVARELGVNALVKMSQMTVSQMSRTPRRTLSSGSTGSALMFVLFINSSILQQEVHR